MQNQGDLQIEKSLPQFESRGVGNGHYEAARVPVEKLVGPDGKKLDLTDYIGEYSVIGKFLVFIDEMQRVWLLPYFSSAVRLEVLCLGYMEDCRDVDNLDSMPLSKLLRQILESDHEIKDVYQSLIEQYEDTEMERGLEVIADESFAYIDKLTGLIREVSGYKIPLAKAKNMAVIQSMRGIHAQLSVYYYEWKQSEAEASTKHGEV